MGRNSVTRTLKEDFSVWEEIPSLERSTSIVVFGKYNFAPLEQSNKIVVFGKILYPAEKASHSIAVYNKFCMPFG